MEIEKSKFLKILYKLILKIHRLILQSTAGTVAYQNIFEQLYQLSILGMNFGCGGNISQSGELEAIKYIKSKYSNSNKKIIVFDVGANVGGYTTALLELLNGKNTQIHSFEPSRKTFKKLKDNIGENQQVILHNFGFGAENTSMKLFMDRQLSGLASVYQRRLNHFNINMDNYEKIEIKKIDDFCKTNNINKIDFLKLDVEGHEYSVLQGAKQMIKEDKIRFIQFEFGGCNIDSRTYFQDFYYLLEPKYNLYRIVKDGLEPIKEYKEIYEIFTTINYLAEHKNK